MSYVSASAKRSSIAHSGAHSISVVKQNDGRSLRYGPMPPSSGSISDQRRAVRIESAAVRLNEARDLGWTVVRDGEFSDLSLGSRAGPDRLSYAVDGAHVVGPVSRKAAAIVTTREAAALVDRGIALATSDDPEGAFFRLHAQLAAAGFYWTDAPSRIDP